MEIIVDLLLSDIVHVLVYLERRFEITVPLRWAFNTNN